MAKWGALPRRLPALLLAAALLTGCSEHFLLRTGIKTADAYLEGRTAEGTAFEQLTEHVWTAKWTWYRTLVVDTPEGLVVFDPMGPRMMEVLKRGIAEHFPGKRVHSLIYTHYHLDHVVGGASLNAAEVIGHERCPPYWNELHATDIAPITKPISGDQKLVVGGVEIEALYLPHSHSDTLYAFYFPGEKLLFTADLGLVKTVPPGGVPDTYWPGYAAALDRVAALDFTRFVPSHFDTGTKQDLVDYIALLKTARSLAKQSYERHQKLINPAAPWEVHFDEIYPPLQEKYGSWHGFDAVFINSMVRDLTGEAVGF